MPNVHETLTGCESHKRGSEILSRFCPLLLYLLSQVGVRTPPYWKSYKSVHFHFTPTHVGNTVEILPVKSSDVKAQTSRGALHFARQQHDEIEASVKSSENWHLVVRTVRFVCRCRPLRTDLASRCSLLGASGGTSTCRRFTEA